MLAAVKEERLILDLTGKPTETPRSRLTMALAALGVVYGDLGTSPLYAVRA